MLFVSKLCPSANRTGISPGIGGGQPGWESMRRAAGLARSSFQESYAYGMMLEPSRLIPVARSLPVSREFVYDYPFHIRVSEVNSCSRHVVFPCAPRWRPSRVY